MTLARLRSKGVHLWCENGQVHFKAPKGVLTQEDIDTLKTYRNEITSLLEQADSLEQLEPHLVDRPQRQTAPLAYSQIAHWNTERLQERRVLRGVASTTRLRGPLNIERLRSCLHAVVRRHEALRTRIVLIEGSPVQVFTNEEDYHLDVHNIELGSSVEGEREARRLTEQYLKQTIDVTADPLFAAWLLRLADDEHVLILAMEHIISDGTSRDILLRDLFDAYEQASVGGIALPPVPMQFSDFACWQHKVEATLQKRYHTYWAPHLAGGARSCLPRDLPPSPQTSSALGALEFQIDGELLDQLRHLCKTYATTPPIALLTAYAAFVLRWCNLSETVIQYQTDGRFSRMIQPAIGYFAFTLYVKAKLDDHDTFLDLKQRVVEDYCNAHEHTDLGYIKARLPTLGVTRNTTFNWVTQEGPRTDGFTVTSPEGTLRGSMFTVDKIDTAGHIMDEEPSVGWLGFPDRIRCIVTYPLAEFSPMRMQEFSQQLLAFIRELLSRPNDPVRTLPIRRPQ
jgi:hypothetical protein